MFVLSLNLALWCLYLQHVCFHFERYLVVFPLLIDVVVICCFSVILFFHFVMSIEGLFWKESMSKISIEVFVVEIQVVNSLTH